MNDVNRGRSVDFALAAIAWCRSRRATFTARDFAEAHGISLRSGYRWLGALEAAGLVEVDALCERRGRWAPNPTRWRTLRQA